MSGSTTRRRVTKPAGERRGDILAAALRLFHERGFDATTVQDIAKAANVAAGTVYLYFPSKEHVLLAIHEAFHAEMQARLEALADELLERLASGEVTYEDAVDGVLDVIAGYLAQQRAETTVICRYLPRLHDQAYDEDRDLTRFIAAVLAAGTAQGYIHTTDAEMSAYLLTAAVRETLSRAIAYGDPPDYDRLVAQAKELFRKALAPQGS